MPAENDILSHIDPAVRRRVEEEMEKYAPFLGMMGAWKAAMEEQLKAIESNVTARLAEQFFPQGDWRFPAQTVAVPQELRERGVALGAHFSDPHSGAAWTPCGPGWTRPTEIVEWTIERKGWDLSAFVCEIRFESQKPGEPLLTPPPSEEERGGEQLAFVCGSEPLVAGLAKARWAIQYPGKPFEPINVARYEGYMEFEREMSVARLTQRQLEAWLPPCYPYSRKFLRFFVTNQSNPVNADDWSWLGESGQNVRLAALIDSDTADLLNAEAGEHPLILNAVPMMQMRMQSDSINITLHTVGEGYKVPFAAIANVFAAAARSTDARGNVKFHRVTFSRAPHESLREVGRDHQPLDDVHVTCDQTAQEVRVYYDCLGEESNPGREHPDSLNRVRDKPFKVIMPSVGGMNSSFTSSDGAGRRYWYHSLLRPALLTMGDVQEILSHLPMCRAHFDLQNVSVQLDVVNQPWVERTPWDTYLWPTLISEASLLELRTSYLTKSRVPIIPVMRLSLPQSRSVARRFLLDDVARYAASVLSQYFMIGWYRIEAQVIES
jgi:hypothetical protein